MYLERCALWVLSHMHQRMGCFFLHLKSRRACLEPSRAWHVFPARRRCSEQLSDLHVERLEGKREGRTRTIINRVKESGCCIKISLQTQNGRTKCPCVDQETGKAGLEPSQILAKGLPGETTGLQ